MKKEKDFVYSEPLDCFPEESRERFREASEKKREQQASLTELVFILDRSGSMSGLESDTIGGFNSMLKEQKGKDGKCLVSTVLFDSEIVVIHDRLPIEKVKRMTSKDYTVRGCTALYDAVGTSINHIKKIHRYARKEDVPENTVFVIITDGFENASHMFTSAKLKKLIEQQKEKGWEFLFVGANIDAVMAAGEIGIECDRAVNYIADEMGTDVVYRNVSRAVGAVRNNMPLGKKWSEEINADYNKRKK